MGQWKKKTIQPKKGGEIIRKTTKKPKKKSPQNTFSL